ncbi:transcriptional regulator [Salmonella enterica]|nr:transcriptional regulator [Salmonella enterica]
MTEYNRIPARQVIIHGDCWPVVNTVAHLTRKGLSGCECETTHTLSVLQQQVQRKPEAILLLCLRPREHIFLFYALKQALLYHPVLVISDELLFSDRVVLHCWGELPAMLHQEVAATLSRTRQPEKLSSAVKNKLDGFLADPKPATGLFAIPPVFNNPKRLMNYMELLMYRATVNCGVTPDQQKLLEEIHNGQYSMPGLKKKLNKNEKQIWQDKYRLLVKLGMKNRLHELFYGTRLSESQQRTPFIMPGDTERNVTFRAGQDRTLSELNHV